MWITFEKILFQSARHNVYEKWKTVKLLSICSAIHYCKNVMQQRH